VISVRILAMNLLPAFRTQLSSYAARVIAASAPAATTELPASPLQPEHFQNIAKVISAAATKLAMLFQGGTPTSADVSSLLAEVDQALLVLLQLYDVQLPSCAPSLFRLLRLMCKEVFTSFTSLLIAIEARQQNLAPATGVVWKACEEIQRLSLDNAAALRTEFSYVKEALADALSELSDAIASSAPAKAKPAEDDDDGWCGDEDNMRLPEEARPLAEAACVLLKVASSLTASVGEGRIALPLQPAAQEASLARFRRLSELADEAACALYSFEEPAAARAAVATLKQALSSEITRLLDSAEVKADKAARARLESSLAVLDTSRVE
jgi:hypothetical protein